MSSWIELPQWSKIPQEVLGIEEEKYDGSLLVNEIDRILSDKKVYETLSKSASSLGVKNSATKIYEILKSLIDGE